MLLTFAYAMVNYYDTSIPGLGFSIKGFHRRRHDQSYERHWVRWFHHMLNEIHSASSKTGPSIAERVMSPYYAIVYFVVQFSFSHAGRNHFRDPCLTARLRPRSLDWLGPIFIPFLVVDKLDWFVLGVGSRRTSDFSFYRVVAAATMMFCLMF